MRAVVLNCSLKASPEPSNTQMLTDSVIAEMRQLGVESEVFRIADHDIKPGVSTDMGDGDEWPRIHEALLGAQILVIATPTWVGRHSSLAQRVMERMDAMLSETDDDGRPVLFNRVAGVVATGNEDGAKHAIGEIWAGLLELGCTVPGQAYTYWNRGPGPGPSYADSDEGKDWSTSTGKAMASNLVAVASALAAKPIPPPPSSS